MGKLIEQVQKMSIATIATVVGIITGCIAILVFAGNIYDAAGKLVVTDDELSAVEKRIVVKIQQEAVLTRSVFIQELIERKTRLSESLGDTNDAGTVAQILEKIQELNSRIKKLRGE